MNEFESYLYGLILTDGSIYLTTRNRGKITIELNAKDTELLKKLQKRIPESKISYRTRSNSFKQEFHTATFANYQKPFRDFFIENGIPPKNKSIIGAAPICEYSERDFWRGVYDGNGSLGFTKRNAPFISLVTKSEKLKTQLLNLLTSQFGIHKTAEPNKRDHVYNILLSNENAQIFSRYLYDDAEIFLQRKYDKYIEIQNWVRTTKKIHAKSWTEEEVQYITTHTVQESMEHLNRTERSIKMKLWRL